MRAFVVETWSSRGAEDERSWERRGWRGLGCPSRRTIARTIRLVGAAGFVLGSLVWMSHVFGHSSAQTAPLPNASASTAFTPNALAPSGLAWRELDKPAPLYWLEAPDFTAGPVTYAARHHEAGGGREDVLSLGAFEGATPALRLRLFRRVAEPADSTPLFAAIAHEAAQAGFSVEHSSLPEILPTRFGRFEIADVALGGAAGAGANHLACSGFRLLRDEPALSITGLACGTATAPLQRSALVCLIDRLDLGNVRDDRQLADFFASTEGNRDSSCPTAPSSAGPSALAAADPAEPAGKPATSRKSLRRRYGL